jgi:hypothetical protein
MPTLSAGELLDIWQRGQSLPAMDHALAMLERNQAEPRDCPSDWSIGRRDARLLELYREMAGNVLVGQVTCPGCQALLEVSADAEVLLSKGRAEDPCDLCLQYGEYEIAFRLPTSNDLRAASRIRDIDQATEGLLRRCVIAIMRNGEPITDEPIERDIAQAICDEMSKADPLGDIQLSVECVCGHRWNVGLDITRFLWSHIQTQALRVLNEVHALASRYGWSESDILEMSPFRRARYLELAWS